MELRAWEHAIPISFLEEQSHRLNETKIISRWTQAIPHLLYTWRSTIGCLATAIFVWLGPLEQFLTPQAKFFAVIVPPLAVSKHVGGTIRALFVGLPFIVAAVFFAAAIIVGVSSNNIGARFVLLGLGVFGFEWGGAPFGSLGKKLASGLYVTVILGSSSSTAKGLSVMGSAVSLIAGLALGYAGEHVVFSGVILTPPQMVTGAVIGALLPPRLAVHDLQSRLQRLGSSFGRLLPLLLTERGVDRRLLEEVCHSSYFERGFSLLTQKGCCCRIC